MMRWRLRLDETAIKAPSAIAVAPSYIDALATSKPSSSATML